jgi:hypothetical protein
VINDVPVLDVVQVDHHKLPAERAGGLFLRDAMSARHCQGSALRTTAAPIADIKARAMNRCEERQDGSSRAGVRRRADSGH